LGHKGNFSLTFSNLFHLVPFILPSTHSSLLHFPHNIPSIGTKCEQYFQGRKGMGTTIWYCSNLYLFSIFMKNYPYLVVTAQIES
jgi:hypothetical protein